MPRLAALPLILSVLVLAACGGDDDSPMPAPAEPAAATEPPKGEHEQREERQRPEPKGTEIVVSESQFGPMLFDSEQQAIYLFDKEATSRSECYGACAEAWPPVLTDGEPQAGGGTDAKLLGTTERDDGTTQVTYDGHPLYFYAHEGPGQVLCHNVAEFGGLWLVVQPDGEPAPA